MDSVAWPSTDKQQLLMVVVLRDRQSGFPSPLTPPETIVASIDLRRLERLGASGGRIISFRVILLKFIKLDSGMHIT